MTILWLTLSLILFIVVTARPAFRSISKILEEKAVMIDKDILDADKVRISTETSLIELRSKLVESRLLAKNIRNNAMAAAEDIKNKAADKLKDVEGKKRKSAALFIEYKKRKYSMRLKDDMLEEAIRSIRQDIEGGSLSSKASNSRSIQGFTHVIKRVTLH